MTSYWPTEKISYNVAVDLSSSPIYKTQIKIYEMIVFSSDYVRKFLSKFHSFVVTVGARYLYFV